jgi:hypothetical protein
MRLEPIITDEHGRVLYAIEIPSPSDVITDAIMFDPPIEWSAWVQMELF